MKRILFAGAFALAVGGPVVAADLPQPMAPPPPRAPATYVPAAVPYYNWGGIYIGINGGGEFGTFTPGAGAGGVGSFSTTGFLLGPTVGANFQAGAFVFGVEGDWDYANISGTIPAAGGGGTTPIGWTAGAGVEFAFAQNWTAKAEYLFIDFPTVTFTAGGGSFSSKETENIVRAGVNYKFNF